MIEVKDTIWQTFASNGETIPDIKAIQAPDRDPLLFRDLPDRLTHVRDVLNGCGVGRGDIVAGVLPQGPETAVCLIGVAACATYFPIDFSLTTDELTRFFSRLKPKAVIVPEGQATDARRVADTLGIMTINLTPAMDGPAGTFSLKADGTGPCASPGWAMEDDVAFIMATSGTSSDHKLVPRKQRHVIAQIHPSIEHFQFDQTDIGLHIMPLFHGHGMEQALIVPLLAGCGVVRPPTFDIPSFFKNLRAFEPTWFSAGFAHLAGILEATERYPEIVKNSRITVYPIWLGPA
jgi:acyl-CoA synthetase (AMP-forming)/AMP-acid ligase II